jgi:hypothetical protein
VAYLRECAAGHICPILDKQNASSDLDERHAVQVIDSSGARQDDEPAGESKAGLPDDLAAAVQSAVSQRAAWTPLEACEFQGLSFHLEADAESCAGTRIDAAADLQRCDHNAGVQAVPHMVMGCKNRGTGIW